MRQDRGRQKLLDEGLEDLLLVSSALVVAVREAVSLTAESEHLVAEHIVPSLIEMVFIRIAVKRILYIDVKSVHCVDQLDQGVEVDAYEVGDVNAVQLFERSHRRVHAVDTGVCQLISDAVRYIRDRDKIVTRRGSEQDFLGLGVDSHYNVDVASAGLGDVAVDVDTADQNVEGFAHIDGLFLNTGLNAILIEHPDLILVLIIVKRLCYDRCVSLVIDRSVDLSFQEGLGGLYVAAVLFHLDL